MPAPTHWPYLLSILPPPSNAPPPTSRRPESAARGSTASPCRNCDGDYLRTYVLNLNEMLAVIFQFLDRFVNIGERGVLAFLVHAARDLRLPAFHQLLEGGHVEIAVMKLGFQIGDVAREKTPVLADGVAAHRRLAPAHQGLQK